MRTLPTVPAVNWHNWTDKDVQSLCLLDLMTRLCTRFYGLNCRKNYIILDPASRYSVTDKCFAFGFRVDQDVLKTRTTQHEFDFPDCGCSCYASGTLPCFCSWIGHLPGFDNIGERSITQFKMMTSIIPPAIGRLSISPSRKSIFPKPAFSALRRAF